MAYKRCGGPTFMVFIRAPYSITTYVVGANAVWLLIFGLIRVPYFMDIYGMGYECCGAPNFMVL